MILNINIHLTSNLPYNDKITYSFTLSETANALDFIFCRSKIKIINKVILKIKNYFSNNDILSNKYYVFYYLSKGIIEIDLKERCKSFYVFPNIIFSFENIFDNKVKKPQLELDFYGGD